ncbi:MAG: hypothetical protein IJF01_07415 [Tidjanibacter sp.]|nr:hypothetical protein [Tidjanibacter sp.]
MTFILAHYYNNLPKNRKAAELAEFTGKFRWATFSFEEWQRFGKLLTKMVEEKNAKYSQTKTFHVTTFFEEYSAGGPHISIRLDGSDHTLSMGFEVVGKSYTEIEFEER